MKPVGLGIIGCGIAARELHWPALKTLPDKFSVRLACNRTESKALEYAKLTGCTVCVTDYREAVEHRDVEAVVIALPFHLNLEVTRAALDAGRHVIVEKPLASTPAEAGEMVELEHGNPGLVTMVAENFRYRPLYERAREIIRNGDIGEPYHVLANYCFFVDPETNKYAGTSWRMDTRYTGGFIVDAGVHTTALLRLLLGEFESGRGTIRSVTPALGAYDTLSFRFRMSSGVDGVMNLFYSSKGYRANAVHVFGGNGTLIVERQRLVLMREGSDELVEEYPDDLGYRGEFVNFHAAVRNNQAVVSTFEEGYRDYMVIHEAVMSSIERRDAVFS